MHYMEIMLVKLCESATTGNIQAARLMINISEKYGLNETPIQFIPPFVPTRGQLARQYAHELPDDYPFEDDDL